MIHAYAIGIGIARNIKGDQLIRLIDQGIEKNPHIEHNFSFFSFDVKSKDVALLQLGAYYHTGVQFLTLSQLLSRKDDVLTHSPRIFHLYGLGSICEAAALFGAGVNSRLMTPKVSHDKISYAIAASSAANIKTDQ